MRSWLRQVLLSLETASFWASRSFKQHQCLLLLDRIWMAVYVCIVLVWCHTDKEYLLIVIQDPTVSSDK